MRRFFKMCLLREFFVVACPFSPTPVPPLFSRRSGFPRRFFLSKIRNSGEIFDVKSLNISGYTKKRPVQAFEKMRDSRKTLIYLGLLVFKNL
jgi:hypothetical protein